MNFIPSELKKISDALTAIKNANDTDNGWKQAALSWQYLYELAINDNAEEILAIFQDSDMIEIQYNYSSTLKKVTQCYCRIYKRNYYDVTGVSNHSIINAIKDAKTKYDKL